MIYLLTTDPGLEAVAADELREQDPAAVVEPGPYGQPGQLRVETEDADPLFRLTTIHHVVQLHTEARVETVDEIREVIAQTSFAELRRATSFRVTVVCRGDHPFDRFEIARAVGAVIGRRYGTPVDLERFAVNVRVDLYGDRLVCGVQLTKDSLGQRVKRSEPLRSALRPTVAAAMLRLGRADRGPGRLIDPMCGAATIPIEAQRINPTLEIAAADWDPPTVELARRSIAEHGLQLTVEHADARSLGQRRPGGFDYIVSDPPYGVRQARRTSMGRLYGALLPAFERALADGGRIVLLVLKYQTFLVAVDRTGLEILDQRKVDLGGLTPRIVVLGHGG